MKTRLLTIVLLLGGLASRAFGDSFVAGDLVVSRVEYTGDPTIFNNPSISGIQGAVYLDQYTPAAGSARVSTLALPTGSSGISTSFSSKSEGALTRSVDGQFLTYMGYQAQVGLQGVSNSYTPGANIAGNTNPTYNRNVALISAGGSVSLTPEANAFSGDNPRAVVTVNGNQFYMAGNSDSTQPAGGTIGARYGTPGSSASIQLGSYQSIYDTSVKDNNWRGIGIYNGNLYVSKGSGSNGVNGVFQVGAGIPVTGGQTITELPGFPTDKASATSYFPFGFWFANATTLYVADEGPGTTTADPLAGLQKWSLAGGVWHLDYTLQNGLNLDIAQTVAGYPVQTYTTGLRNMTGTVNADGTVSVYAITAQYSSISGGEPDPTRLVGISDLLSATILPGSEEFATLQDSGAGEVFRGVAFAPTSAPEPATALPAAAALLLLVGAGAKRCRDRPLGAAMSWDLWSVRIRARSSLRN